MRTHAFFEALSISAQLLLPQIFRHAYIFLEFEGIAAVLVLTKTKHHPYSVQVGHTFLKRLFRQIYII